MYKNIKTTWDSYHASFIRNVSGDPTLREIPLRLYDYWHDNAHKEFPGIPKDAVFFMWAAEGLLMFFRCIAIANKTCALPSKAADSVWHAWIAMDEEGLNAFCRKWVGRTIPHTEAERLDVPLDQALANTLITLRQLQNLPEAGDAVPALFKLDHRLRMPGGFGYKSFLGSVGFAHLGENGKPAEEWNRHYALLPATLLGFGLISESAYTSYRDALIAKQRNDGSSCGGSGCGSSGDGGGCGSGCGGCGGGCG
jgi:hypothetical protein